MSDYTLPPLPALGPFHAISDYTEGDMRQYGKHCAEAGRAPLLARIAELEAERDLETRALLWVCMVYIAGDELPPEVQAKQALAAAERIRAEVRAKIEKESGDA